MGLRLRFCSAHVNGLVNLILSLLFVLENIGEVERSTVDCLASTTGMNVQCGIFCKDVRCSLS